MKRKSPRTRSRNRSPRKTARGGPFFGYHKTSRRMATLAQVVDPNIPTDSVGELDHSQLVELVVARLRADKYFIPLFMLGFQGVVDKKRAIREVQKGSPIGLHLIEIEKEYMRLQLAGGR